jgi:hypothetical protein
MGLLKMADMADMQQVKDTVAVDDFLVTIASTK